MKRAGGVPPQTKLLDHDDRAKWSQLDAKPFMFRHHLAHHPLFEIPRLARLAERAIEQGDQDQYISDENRNLSKLERTRRLVDNISQLEEGNHWLKLVAINKLDPDYDDLLQSLLAEVEVLTDSPIREVMAWSALTVFMNSPNLLVPYHFDHDTNFLMQVRGEKDVYLFDREDRSVLTEAEIEDYYRGNAMAGRYREDLKDAGKCHHLSPGVAVYQPPLAPHLIRNGNQVSISVSFYFILPNENFRARVYQCNYLLRKLGLRPPPPGESAVLDSLKSGLIKAFSTSNPASWHDVVYSGVDRISTLSRLAAGVVGKRKSP